MLVPSEFPLIARGDDRLTILKLEQGGSRNIVEIGELLSRGVECALEDSWSLGKVAQIEYEDEWLVVPGNPELGYFCFFYL